MDACPGTVEHLTHVVSAGFLLAAVACTAAMAVMMRGMGHGGGQPPGN